MRPANTYRGAKRNAWRRRRAPARAVGVGNPWFGISDGPKPRLPHNARKLKAPPVFVAPIVPPTLSMLMLCAGIIKEAA